MGGLNNSIRQSFLLVLSFVLIFPSPITTTVVPYVSVALSQPTYITVSVHYNTSLGTDILPSMVWISTITSESSVVDGGEVLPVNGSISSNRVGTYRSVELERVDRNRAFYVMVPTSQGLVRYPRGKQVFYTYEDVPVVNTKSWWDGIEAPLAAAIPIAFFDLLTALAYFQIGGEYYFYGIRKLKGLPYLWVLWFFILFTLSCGVLHCVQSFQHFFRTYTILMLVKMWTGCISLITAFTCFWILPALRKLPIRRRDLYQESHELELIIKWKEEAIEEKEAAMMAIFEQFASSQACSYAT